MICLVFFCNQNCIVSCFFLCTENCAEYLTLWLQHVQFLKEFNWISLDNSPEWNDIDKTARLMMEKGLFAKEDHQKLFHNFGILEATMNKDQILKYTNRKLSIVDRWVDFFSKCADENYDCGPLITIVSYVLTIPGTFLYLIYINLCTTSDNFFPNSFKRD